MLGTVKEHIKQGFQWGAREGPLCDERMIVCYYPEHLLNESLQQCVMSNSAYWMQALRQSPYFVVVDRLFPQRVVFVILHS